MTNNERAFFRQVMGRFATGIAVVTTCSDNSMVGLTVNSFCSVSLDPPLVLVCIDHNSHTLSHFQKSGTFVINILSEQQERLSRCFATSSLERYEHFCNARYHLSATNSPIIDDALAFIDTRVVAQYPMGDHIIFVGQVETIGAGGQVVLMSGSDTQDSHSDRYDASTLLKNEAAPLLYYRGQYRHLAPDYQPPKRAVYAEEPSYVKVGE